MFEAENGDAGINTNDNNNIILVEIIFKDIKETVMKTKDRKSAGSDGINNELVKYGFNDLLVWLHKL